MIETARSLLDALIGAGLGAGCFRLRGDAAFERWTGHGIGTARIVVWALPLGALWGAFGGMGPGWTAAMVVALWLGSLPAWWGSLDMGRQAHSAARDLAMHSLRGLVWTAPPAAVAGLALGPWPVVLLLLAGALCGPLYALGWRLHGRADMEGTEWGELAFGAAVGAALLGSTP